jgi:hypothetical protein
MASMERLAPSTIAVLTASLALGCATAHAPPVELRAEVATARAEEPAADTIPSYASRPRDPRVVIGPWEHERIGGGDWIAGLGVIDGKIAAVVRADGETRVMARDGSGWSLLRDDYDAPATFVSLGEQHLVVSREGSFRPVHREGSSFGSPCSLRLGSRAAASATDLWLVHACQESEVVHASHRRGREWESTPLPALHRLADFEAAVEEDGTVHVIGAGPPAGDYRGALRHYVVGESGAREAPFPGEPPTNAWLASCGGRAHALFKTDQRTALAVWDGARWRIGRDEPIARAFVTGFVLDRACHPFVVAGGMMEDARVFSYGRGGWEASVFASGDVTSPRALVSGDAVYVAYAARSADGDMEAWMASARVGAPPSEP